MAWGGGRYVNFFWDLMLNHGCLPLGLYCGVEESSDNQLPFVFSNPPQQTLLHAEDQVYVLSASNFDTANFESFCGR